MAATADTISPEELSDAELVARFRAGDEGALELLLCRYRDALHRYCYGLVGNRDEAEDICQESLTRAISHLDSLESGAAFRPWLFRIGRNLSMDAFRSGKRLHPLPDEEIAPIPSRERGPQEGVELSEEYRTVARAMEDLVPSHRTVLMLREVEGLSYAEIARRLHTSESAIETLLFRARRRLREQYHKRDRAIPGLGLLGSLRGILARLSGGMGSAATVAKAALVAVLLGGCAIVVPHALLTHVSQAASALRVSRPVMRHTGATTRRAIASRRHAHGSFGRDARSRRGARHVSARSSPAAPQRGRRLGSRTAPRPALSGASPSSTRSSAGGPPALGGPRGRRQTGAHTPQSAATGQHIARQLQPATSGTPSTRTDRTGVRQALSGATRASSRHSSGGSAKPATRSHPAGARSASRTRIGSVRNVVPTIGMVQVKVSTRLSRPHLSVPTVSVALPTVGVAVPTVSVSIPKVSVPKVSIPKASVPTVSVVAPKVPTVVPSGSLPTLSTPLPTISPRHPVPTVTVPHATAPTVAPRVAPTAGPRLPVPTPTPTIPVKVQVKTAPTPVTVPTVSVPHLKP